MSFGSCSWSLNFSVHHYIISCFVIPWLMDFQFLLSWFEHYCKLKDMLMGLKLPIPFCYHQMWPMLEFQQWFDQPLIVRYHRKHFLDLCTIGHLSQKLRRHSFSQQEEGLGHLVSTIIRSNCIKSFLQMVHEKGKWIAHNKWHSE